MYSEDSHYYSEMIYLQVLLLTLQLIIETVTVSGKLIHEGFCSCSSTLLMQGSPVQMGI